MGVITYVLLAGYPPFYDEDQKKLFKKIKEGKYHFHEDYWGNTSPEAMDLIRKMLCVNQKDRWSAQQLLTHPWITAGAEQLAQKDLAKSIEALKKFKAKMRFKAAANAIIMTNRMKILGKVRSAANSPNASQSNLVDADGNPIHPQASADAAAALAEEEETPRAAIDLM
jgi:serine/threonine protein kinase